jgi:hypothetical protein
MRDRALCALGADSPSRRLCRTGNHDSIGLRTAEFKASFGHGRRDLVKLRRLVASDTAVNGPPALPGAAKRPLLPLSEERRPSLRSTGRIQPRHVSTA